jgi:hypothetical protein
MDLGEPLRRATACLRHLLRSSRRAIRSITFTPAASRHAFGGSAAIPLAKCTAATIKNEECNIKISFFIFHFSFFISLW